MSLFKRKKSIVRTENSDMNLFERIDQSYEKFSKMKKPYVEKKIDRDRFGREMYLESLKNEEKTDYNKWCIVARGKMGVESFYVKIKNTKISDIKALMEEYGDCWDFSVDNDYFCITGALVSLFPVVELIYHICNAVKDRPLYIGSLNREVCFNFDSYFDFLDWMYKIWREKLDYFNKNFGVFAIKPSKYYKSYSKLQKKYYRKI